MIAKRQQQLQQQQQNVISSQTRISNSNDHILQLFVLEVSRFYCIYYYSQHVWRKSVCTRIHPTNDIPLLIKLVKSTYHYFKNTNTNKLKQFAGCIVSLHKCTPILKQFYFMPNWIQETQRLVGKKWNNSVKIGTIRIFVWKISDIIKITSEDFRK